MLWELRVRKIPSLWALVTLASVLKIAVVLAAEPAPAASAQQSFDVHEYRVLGNTVLSNREIEGVLYSRLGDKKTLDDVEKARAALEDAYHTAGYATVFVDIPPQEVADGIVRLRVTEGRVRVRTISGAHYFSEGKILEQLPALFHLQPPSGTSRLALERFSPYFNNPALGFSERRPAECFRIIYELPERELADLVYVFDAPTRGVGESVLQQLSDLADRWQEAYDANSMLTWDDQEAYIDIEDNRVGWSFGAYRINDPIYCALLRLLERPLPATACLKQLETLGHACELSDIEARLLELKRRGLVFFDGVHYVRLCTLRVPYRIRPAAKSMYSSDAAEMVA